MKRSSNFYRFARTPLPRGTPDAPRGPAVLLRVVAWLGLVASALAILQIAGMLVVVYFSIGLLLDSEEARAGALIGSAILGIVLLLALTTTATAGRAYLAWVQQAGDAVARTRVTAWLIFAIALVVVTATFQPPPSLEPQNTAGMATAGLGLALIIATMGIVILAQNRSNNANSSSPRQPNTAPAACPPHPSTGQTTTDYQCPQCRRQYQLPALPKVGTLCPSCRPAKEP